MDGLQILSQVIVEPWAIHGSVAEVFASYLPVLQSEQNIDLSKFSASAGDGKKEEPVSKVLVAARSGSAPSDTQQYVMVIRYAGVVMKYDTWYGYGTQSIARMIAAADANPEVIGTVLILDSPGGMVSGTESIASVIWQHQKPIVAFVDGMAASAAYWMACGTDHIMVSGNTSLLGSIGTMFGLVDVTPALEKLGAKKYELYASQSSQKNTAWRSMQEGDNKPMIARLTQYQNVFEAAVITGRGDKLNKSKTLNGQDYLTSEAIEYGLADSTGTLQDAINMVAELAASGLSKSDRTPMGFFGITTPAAIKALVGKAPSAVTEEALDAANAAIEEEGIKGFELVRQADLTGLQTKADGLEDSNATLTKQLADMTAAKTKAEGELATAKTELTAANAALVTANAKITELGGKPGAEPANPASAANSEAKADDRKHESFLTSVDTEAKQLFNSLNSDKK